MQALTEAVMKLKEGDPVPDVVLQAIRISPREWSAKVLVEGKYHDVDGQVFAKRYAPGMSYEGITFNYPADYWEVMLQGPNHPEYDISWRRARGGSGFVYPQVSGSQGEDTRHQVYYDRETIEDVDDKGAEVHGVIFWLLSSK